MKRLILLISMILISSGLMAQEEILLNNLWIMESMDNELSPGWPYENDEFDTYNLQLTFTEESGTIHFHSQMCQNYDGIAEITNESIAFTNLVLSGEPCSGEMNQYYESAYSYALSATYNFQIENNSDGSPKLVMNNNIFMGMVFNGFQLGTKDLSENPISVWPNPAQDFINFDNIKGEIKEIKILNSSGKLMDRKKVNPLDSMMDISYLPAGVYILVFESDNKVIKKKKLIKK